MIPLQAGGAIVFSTPQGVPAGTVLSQGAADFPSFFEHMIMSGVAAQVADETVPGGPIGILDALAGRKNLPACQSFSDGSSEKGPAERSSDPVSAVLIAIVSGSTQRALLEPSPDFDYIADFLSSDVALAPAVATIVGASTQPLFTREADVTSELADIHAVDSVAVARSLDSTRVISVEIDPHLKPEVSSQETRAAIVTPGPPLPPQGLSITPLPVDAETHTAYGDGLSTSMQVRAPSPSSSARISSGRKDGQGEGDLRSNNPYLLVEKPAGPVRGVQEVIRMDRFEARSDVDRIADLSPPGPAAVLPHAGLSAMEAWAELSATVQQSVAEPQGSSQMFQWAAARPPLVMPHANANQSKGNQKVEDLFFTKDTCPAVTSVQGAQDGISRSSGGEVVAQLGGSPPMMAVLEDPARVTVVLSEAAASRSFFSHRPAVRTTISSDISEVLESEVCDSERFRKQIQVNADDDRVAIRQASSRLEATQRVQQDELASDSESGSSLPDRSSPPSGGRPGLTADFTLSAASRTEGLRSGPVVPAGHPRALSDELTEPIAMAARLSQRNEENHVQLRLHPQALGELVIEVSWKDNGIVAAIKVQSHVAGELLANDLGRLRIALVEQGIPVSNLGVQVELDLRQWSYAGNGSQDSPAIGHLPEVMLRHDKGSMLPMVPVMGPDSLIDITV